MLRTFFLCPLTLSMPICNKQITSDKSWGKSQTFHCTNFLHWKVCDFSKLKSDVIFCCKSAYLVPLARLLISYYLAKPLSPHLVQGTREHRIQMFCQNRTFRTKKMFCTVLFWQNILKCSYFVPRNIFKQQKHAIFSFNLF